MSEKVPTKSEVWNMFRKVDLTPYHESKYGDLTFVNWARVWGIAMDLIGNHLEVKWHGMTTGEGVVLDHIRYPDKTASVCSSAFVGGEKYAECTLAVMNGSNNAISNPTSVDLQNSRQRCQTKLLAMLGLGLYLWENDGEWESKTPTKNAPKAKKTPVQAKKSKAPAKKTEEIESDSPDAEDLHKELSKKCNQLYTSGWEADKKLQDRIRKAVRNNDVQEMTSLIKILNDMLPVALELHDGGIASA